MDEWEPPTGFPGGRGLTGPAKADAAAPAAPPVSSRRWPRSAARWACNTMDAVPPMQTDLARRVPRREARLGASIPVRSFRGLARTGRWSGQRTHRVPPTDIGDRGPVEQDRVGADVAVGDVEGRFVLHLEVQVRLVGVAGITDLADHLTAPHRIAHVHAQAAALHVPVEHVVPVADIDDHMVARHVVPGVPTNWQVRV